MNTQLEFLSNILIEVESNPGDFSAQALDDLSNSAHEIYLEIDVPTGGDLSTLEALDSAKAHAKNLSRDFSRYASYQA